MEENRGFTIKDLLIRLILIVVFIFLLIWLFPMPDLTPLNNQIFAQNIDRMKNVAKTYYTVERLPQNINDYKKMTLKEMVDNKLILPLMDSNGKYCSQKDSYIQITKLENEYVIKVFLSCTDKQDYVIEHFGCYDICSRECQMLETTTQSNSYGTGSGKKILFKKTTKNDLVTTKKNSYLYEYQYTKSICSDKFDKYTCDSGYYLVGNKCIKNGTRVDTKEAIKEVTNVISTDTKNAKAIVTDKSEMVNAKKSEKEVTSVVNANKLSKKVDQVVTSLQTITANKHNTYDVKGAIANVTATTANYTTVQNYDIITATKYATTSGWTYVSTRTSTNGNEAFVGENEKLVLVGSYQQLACSTCFSTVTVYKYYRYKKTYGGYTYSCDNFPGYSLYDGDKCRKATTVSKGCPSGYTDTGSNCKKTTTTYSCSSYGSSYVLDSNKKTCTKTTTSYSCPAGTTQNTDKKYCTKKVYGCPSGTTSDGNGKCLSYSYSCPSNTSDKTYTLLGTKCAVKAKQTVYTCQSGTTKSTDERYCIKVTKNTKYSCSDYDGYNLVGKKCVKTITTPKTVYKCSSGYTLSGTSCIKTVNTKDTKNANKTYKSVCDNEYKWSTSTSLSGWSYTGNKRVIGG